MHMYDHLEGQDVWVAFFDVDEFVVLRKHKTIQEMLQYCSSEGGSLSLSWILFGSSGETHYRPEPVFKRFQMRSKDVQKTVKNISYIPHISQASTDPHFQLVNAPFTQHDCHGRSFSGANNDHPNEDIAAINHYFVKSYEEFCKKRARGHSGTGTYHLYDIRAFQFTDLNHIEDTRAWDLYREKNG